MTAEAHTVIEPISAEAFAPFGTVIEIAGHDAEIINRGMCERFDDLVPLDVSDGRAGISLFKAEIRELPLELDMVERHPLGCQAFVPMSADGFLVVVAPDEGGRPGAPRAFVTEPGQGVHYRRGVWHGVLMPLAGSGLFAVIDRIGAEDNLEEFHFETPHLIVRGPR